MKVLLLILAALVELAIRGGAAQAQSAEDVQLASKLMTDGGKSLEQHDFAAALSKFTEAMTLVPNHKIEFGIGLAHEGLRQPALAYQAFSRYLAGPRDENGERWAEAVKHQSQLRQQVTFLEVNANAPGALLTVDGGRPVKLPLLKPIVLDAGTHKVEVNAEGLVWSEAVAGQGGGSIALTPQLRAPRPAPDFSTVAQREPTAAKDAHTAALPVASNRRVWLWTTVAVVLAGIAATAIVLSTGGTTQYACPPDVECIGAK